ncbi:MAG: carbohydrate porin, partial [Nostoc sp.]
EPKLTSLSKNVNLGAGNGVVDKDTSLHIEGFYQYQVNDNIAITPGVIWITAPDFNADNPDSVVLWLRTTFRF